MIALKPVCTLYISISFATDGGSLIGGAVMAQHDTAVRLE